VKKNYIGLKGVKQCLDEFVERELFSETHMAKENKSKILSKFQRPAK
jgi:hypothetical protein